MSEFSEPSGADADGGSARLRTDGGEQRQKRQIGPRLDPDLAQDFEVIIRHLHNGKYKGRLSDEVEKALALYMGKVLTDHPKWADDADEEQRERFKGYAKRFQDACSRAPMDSAVAEEIHELRREVEAVNATSTNMLSQILAQVNDSGGSAVERDSDDPRSADT
jgi:hypothetical protein